MEMINQAIVRGLIILLLPTLIPSCAAIPELKVHYRLPPASDQLKGKKVVLALEDARTTKEILGQGAQEEIGNFSGHFTFSFAPHRKPGCCIKLPFTTRHQKCLCNLTTFRERVYKNLPCFCPSQYKADTNYNTLRNGPQSLSS